MIVDLCGSLICDCVSSLVLGVSHANRFAVVVLCFVFCLHPDLRFQIDIVLYFAFRDRLDLKTRFPSPAPRFRFSNRS